MANSLHALFFAIATANDERELRLRFMDTVGEYFGVQRWGIYLLDEQSRLAAFDVQGVPDGVLDHYEEVGRAVDPVMRYVVERHAPAHEQLVLGPEGWKQSELYQHFGSSYDQKHITSPLLSRLRSAFAADLNAISVKISLKTKLHQELAEKVRGVWMRGRRVDIAHSS